MIAQLSQLPAYPSPHSRVIFVNDPLQDWEMRLLADVAWDDPTVEVSPGRKLDHPPDLASYDRVLTFEGDSLRILRRP